MKNANHLHTEPSPVYVLVCRQPDGQIRIPPFSTDNAEEALARFEDESESPVGAFYGCELVRVLKAFEVSNGRVTWVNRDAVGDGPALYVALDSSCYGVPCIDFNHLLDADEAGRTPLTTVRVY